MPLRLCLFECECGYSYEELLHKDSGQSVKFDPVVACPACGRENHQSIGMPNVASFSAKSREDQISSLKKRSEEHSRKLMKKNQDEIRHKMSGGKIVS